MHEPKPQYISTVLKGLLTGCLFGLAIVALVKFLPIEDQRPGLASGKEEIRFFKNVDPDRTVAQVLVRGQMRPGYGNVVDLVEVDSHLKPKTGDTLEVWVQHYAPGQENQKTRLLRKSQEYDLLVHCFPQSVPDGVRTDNVLPEADSLVHVYPLMADDFTAISGSRSRALEFMSAYNVKQAHNAPRLQK
jgi:hypothetical protein